jgi:hypothetical protein
MFASLAHRFREFRAMWRDILPQSGRNPNCRVVALHVAIQREQNPRLDESRQDGAGEISPDFVLTQSSRFTANIETFGPKRPQIVVAIVRGDVPYQRQSVFIGRPDDCV